MPSSAGKQLGHAARKGTQCFLALTSCSISFKIGCRSVSEIGSQFPGQPHQPPPFLTVAFSRAPLRDAVIDLERLCSRPVLTPLALRDTERLTVVRAADKSWVRESNPRKVSRHRPVPSYWSGNPWHPAGLDVIALPGRAPSYAQGALHLGLSPFTRRSTESHRSARLPSMARRVAVRRVVRYARRGAEGTVIPRQTPWGCFMARRSTLGVGVEPTARRRPIRASDPRRNIRRLHDRIHRAVYRISQHGPPFKAGCGIRSHFAV